MNNFTDGGCEVPVKESIRVKTEKQLAEIWNKAVEIRNGLIEFRNGLVGPAPPLIPENEKKEAKINLSLIYSIQDRHWEIRDMLGRAKEILEELKNEIG